MRGQSHRPAHEQHQQAIGEFSLFGHVLFAGKTPQGYEQPTGPGLLCFANVVPAVPAEARGGFFLFLVYFDKLQGAALRPAALGRRASRGCRPRMFFTGPRKRHASLRQPKSPNPAEKELASLGKVTRCSLREFVRERS